MSLPAVAFVGFLAALLVLTIVVPAGSIGSVAMGMVFGLVAAYGRSLFWQSHQRGRDQRAAIRAELKRSLKG